MPRSSLEHMRSIHALIAAAALVVVLAGAGFAIWKLLSGRSPGKGPATPPAV